MDPALLESVRDELLLQKKVVEDQADSLRALQAQLQQLRTSSEQTSRRDGDHSRQLTYLTQQRDELQRRLEDLQMQQTHWQEQSDAWREKDKQRRVRQRPRTATLLHASSSSLSAISELFYLQCCCRRCWLSWRSSASSAFDCRRSWYAAL